MSSEEKIGYRNPPKSTRFKPGQSGNPKGRPRGRHREIPHDAILGQMVTIREEGRERRVSAAEAFLLQLVQKGLAGNFAAARGALEAIERARETQPSIQEHERMGVSFVDIGISTILAELGLAVKKYSRERSRVRWELQPWIVEAAIEKLGDRQLADEEQLEVWKNTHTPRNARWPRWWTAIG